MILNKYILIAFVLAGCSTSKKSVSINKARTDSSAVIHTEQLHIIKADSITNSATVDSGQRVTDVTYTPFETDSSDYIEVPVNSIVIHHGAKKIIYVPHSRVIETGTSTIKIQAQVHKNDSSAKKEDKKIDLKKDIKIVDKQKKRSMFQWWLLLLLLPLLLLSPKIRKIFIP